MLFAFVQPFLFVFFVLFVVVVVVVVVVVANLNPRLAEKRFTVHDLPALSVRYRNPNNSGEEMESVYVVSGSRTFAIDFNGEKPGLSLEQFGNYNTFLQMVKSFEVKP
jgi:hypothetical protein